MNFNFYYSNQKQAFYLLMRFFLGIEWLGLIVVDQGIAIEVRLFGYEFCFRQKGGYKDEVQVEGRDR